MTDCGTWVPPGPSKKAIGRPSCSRDEGREPGAERVDVEGGHRGPRAVWSGDPSRSALRAIVARATIEPVSWRAMTARLPAVRRTMPTRRLSARDPRHRHVAPVPPGPRPTRAAARRGAPGRARPVARRVRRAPPAREAPGRRLRMHRLADRVLLSRSGVTRLIDRLGPRRLGRARSLPDATPAARRRSSRRPG